MIKKIMNSTIAWIILIILLIICATTLIIKTDEDRCEKKGGIYIWEWFSTSSKCHVIRNSEENVYVIEVKTN